MPEEKIIKLLSDDPDEFKTILAISRIIKMKVRETRLILERMSTVKSNRIYGENDRYMFSEKRDNLVTKRTIPPFKEYVQPPSMTARLDSSRKSIISLSSPISHPETMTNRILYIEDQVRKNRN